MGVLNIDFHNFLHHMSFIPLFELFRDNLEKMQAEIRLTTEELQQLDKAMPSKVFIGSFLCISIW